MSSFFYRKLDFYEIFRFLWSAVLSPTSSNSLQWRRLLGRGRCSHSSPRTDASTSQPPVSHTSSTSPLLPAPPIIDRQIRYLRWAGKIGLGKKPLNFSTHFCKGMIFGVFIAIFAFSTKNDQILYTKLRVFSRIILKIFMHKSWFFFCWKINNFFKSAIAPSNAPAYSVAVQCNWTLFDGP